MSDGFPPAKLSNRMNEEAGVVLCIPAKSQPQLAKSGHVAVIVPQAQAAWGHSLLLLFTSTPRNFQKTIQQIILSFYVFENFLISVLTG